MSFCLKRGLQIFADIISGLMIISLPENLFPTILTTDLFSSIISSHVLSRNAKHSLVPASQMCCNIVNGIYLSFELVGQKPQDVTMGSAKL